MIINLMELDEDIIMKNPFGFQFVGVVVNDSVTREAITKDQMRKLLKFVHDDAVYCNTMKWFIFSFIQNFEYQNSVV